MNKVLLCIMDGCGIRESSHGNAFKDASKPIFDYLWETFPHSLLEASGEKVGLPVGQMGTSEVGHMNIGAGRIVYQPQQLITEKIKSDDFFTNEHLLNVINHVKTNNSKLHIFGLLSDGGIHSYVEHLFAMLDMIKKENVTNVYLHLFTDGRDTLPSIASTFFEQLEKKLNELQIGKIATISGRYYAMDRDNNWERIKKAYDVIVDGIGEEFNTYKEVIEANYSKEVTDEFIMPAVLDKEGMVTDNDGLLVFNFRPDRLRELFSALTNKDLECFPRKTFQNIKLTTMMPVPETVICEHAFALDPLINTIGEYLDEKGIKQLRIAETEKYAHVTYFFDGGIEKDLSNCERILVPSAKVATYDLDPKMQAYVITDKVSELLDKDYLDLVILNYANGDMVGHTGNYDAVITAVETLDTCLGNLYAKAKEKGFTLVVTSDHGNCDMMLDDNNNVVTSHTTSLVPFIVCNEKFTLKDGKLGDIAPTILKIMDIDIPEEMTGEILVKE